MRIGRTIGRCHQPRIPVGVPRKTNPDFFVRRSHPINQLGEHLSKREDEVYEAIYRHFPVNYFQVQKPVVFIKLRFFREPHPVRGHMVIYCDAMEYQLFRNHPRWGVFTQVRSHGDVHQTLSMEKVIAGGVKDEVRDILMAKWPDEENPSDVISRAVSRMPRKFRSLDWLHYTPLFD